MDSNILDLHKKLVNKEIRINSNLPIGKIKNKIINKCINLGYKLSDINELIFSYVKEKYSKRYTWRVSICSYARFFKILDG